MKQQENTTPSTIKQTTKSRKTFPTLSAQEITALKLIKETYSLTWGEIYIEMGFEAKQNVDIVFASWLHGGNITRPRFAALQKFIKAYQSKAQAIAPKEQDLPGLGDFKNGLVKITVAGVSLGFASLNTADEIKAAARAIEAIEGAV